MQNPSKQISFEILDPTRGEGHDVSFELNDAQTAYARGFLVTEHEIVTAYLSSGQKLTTILSTEWSGG